MSKVFWPGLFKIDVPTVKSTSHISCFSVYRSIMSVTDKLIPKVRAEEEDEDEDDDDEDEEDLVDPADKIKEECKTSHCQSYVNKLEACNERVASKAETEETCYEEILDFYHCLDHCASKQIFAKLK